MSIEDELRASEKRLKGLRNPNAGKGYNNRGGSGKLARRIEDARKKKDLENMVPCKFQTPIATNEEASILIYSEDKKIWCQARGEIAETIKKAIGLPDVGGRVFAMARLRKDGQIVVGKVLEEQGW